MPPLSRTTLAVLAMLVATLAGCDLSRLTLRRGGQSILQQVGLVGDDPADAGGPITIGKVIEPKDGRDVYLTIDMHLQEYIEAVLEQQCLIYEPKKATIVLVERGRPAAVPFAVAAWITAAYWCTASTSFANPAVTIARACTDTFAGIRPGDVPAVLVAQILGALGALGVCAWLLEPRSPESRA